MGGVVWTSEGINIPGRSGGIILPILTFKQTHTFYTVELLFHPSPHAHLVGLDPREGNVYDVALCVKRESLDQGGLTRPRRAVQQKSELVRVALDAVLPWECLAVGGGAEG